MDINGLKIGDKVRVRTWGSGVVTGVVEEIYRVRDEEDEGVKNGLPGISYRSAQTESSWCYADQVIGLA